MTKSGAVVLFVLTACITSRVLSGVVPSGFPVADLLTAFGTVTLRLRPDAAPLTVANFAYLARSGFYRNASFYRYEPGFVLQGGGDRYFNDSGASNRTVPLEYKLPNVNLTVGLARDTAPDTGSSEFFVNLGNNTQHLGPNGSTPDGYAVFAEVVGGVDVIGDIARVPTVPVDGKYHVFTSPVVISTINVVNVSATCSDAVLALPIPSSLLPWARLRTQYGTIDWQLRPDATPATVSNFRRLVAAGFYTNSFIYRYEAGFVFQGGMDEFAGHQDRSHYVPLEYCLPNGNLTVGVSRFDTPDSGSSEYFINIGNNTDALAPGGWTPYGYAVFAQVIGGFEALARLTTLPVERVNDTRFHLFRKPYPLVYEITICDSPYEGEEASCGAPKNNGGTSSSQTWVIIIAASAGALLLGGFAAWMVRRAVWRRRTDVAGMRARQDEDEQMAVTQAYAAALESDLYD
jgi:cyclophilin family peptidyl-prolyl cis-trans isomerase